MRISMIMAVLFVTACGVLDNKLVSANSLSDLTAINWTVNSLQGESVIKGTALNFSVFEDGRVKGNAGVNSYNSRWQIDANTIKTSDLAVTKMSLSDNPGVMQQEQRFLTALTAVTSWQIVDKQLQFFQAEKLIVTFKNNGEIKSVK